METTQVWELAQVCAFCQACRNEETDAPFTPFELADKATYRFCSLRCFVSFWDKSENEALLPMVEDEFRVLERRYKAATTDEEREEIVIKLSRIQSRRADLGETWLYCSECKKESAFLTQIAFWAMDGLCSIECFRTHCADVLRRTDPSMTEMKGYWFRHGTVCAHCRDRERLDRLPIKHGTLSVGDGRILYCSPECALEDVRSVGYGRYWDRVTLVRGQRREGFYAQGPRGSVFQVDDYADDGDPGIQFFYSMARFVARLKMDIARCGEKGFGKWYGDPSLPAERLRPPTIWSDRLGDPGSWAIPSDPSIAA